VPPTPFLLLEADFAANFPVVLVLELGTNFPLAILLTVPAALTRVGLVVDGTMEAIDMLDR
jgi:hypothetical protein